LHLKRNLANVAFAMSRWGWRYPCSASEHAEDPERAFLEGLVLADRALSALPAEREDYDALVADEKVLWAALSRLYPDRPLRRTPFMDERFRSRRTETLARRDTREHRRLAARIEEVGQALSPANPYT
jgi:hypothetical protein